MRLTTRRIVAALAVAIATGAGVRAQQGPPPAEFDTRPAGGWTFTPTIRFSTMWDSNVSLAGNQAEGRSTADDRLFNFQPQGQLDYRSPRTDFLAGYSGDVRRYVEASPLNSVDHRAFFSLQRHATRRIVWFVRNDFQDAPTTDEIELNGIPYARTGARHNRLAGGIEARLTRYDDIAVQYENTWVTFDNTTTTLRGGVMNGVRTSYYRRLGEHTKIGAQYRMRHSEITGGRTLWFQDVGSVVAHAFSPATSLQFGAGYSTMRDTRADADRSGLFAHAELLHQAARHDIGLLYERSYAPAFGLGGSSHNQDLRAYLRMPFSSNRVYVQASGGWRRSNSLLTPELSFDQFDWDVTAGYGLARWLRAEVFHIYSRQDSRITGGEINRHRAGVQLVVAQPMRIQ